MITFGLNYDVKPERVEEFVATTRKVLQLMPSVPGHERTRLYRDVDAPNSFLIYSEWATLADFQGFVQSDAFREVQTMGREMLTGRPRHQLYETRAMR
jgi:heme-degrading monooxygenase HmoA